MQVDFLLVVPPELGSEWAGLKGAERTGRPLRGRENGQAFKGQREWAGLKRAERMGRTARGRENGQD